MSRNDVLTNTINQNTFASSIKNIDSYPMNYTSRDNKLNQVLSIISDEELIRFALIENYWIPEEGRWCIGDEIKKDI